MWAYRSRGDDPNIYEMRFIASILFAIFVQPTVTWDSCDSACRSEYQDERKSCERFEDATDGADALRLCIENAKASYDSCFNRCE